MAFGAKKSEIVRKALQEPITDLISASFLRNHPNAAFHLDPEAASAL
jgi:glucosamine-6-phosphate deaminase